MTAAPGQSPAAVPGDLPGDRPGLPADQVRTTAPAGGRASVVDAAADLADAVAAAALGVSGVVRLHAGSFGEVATYLPGRRVLGVRTTGSLTEVHLVCGDDVALIATAEAVRSAVQQLVDTPVDIFVEDVETQVAR